jgi:hypothetical protein
MVKPINSQSAELRCLRAHSPSEQARPTNGHLKCPSELQGYQKWSPLRSFRLA